MPDKTPEEIVNLAIALTAEFPAMDAAKLSTYLGEIALWNPRIGLISKKTTVTSLDRLVRQSAHLLDIIREHDILPAETGAPRVIDIGTGAGFPGLVWKLFEPGLSVVLVERKKKKATFLERIKIVLDLENIDVVEGDATQLATREGFKGWFDVAVSFAVGEPAAMARMVKDLLRENGWYCTLRPQGEVIDDGMAGEPLKLAETVKSEYGQYCLYQKTSD